MKKQVAPETLALRYSVIFIVSGRFLDRCGSYLTASYELIFEVVSPSTADKDRRTKFSIYEREGVAFCCIVDPENEVAKIYALHEGRYVKQMDATDECFRFDLGKCEIAFDFARIWAK